MIQRFTDYNNLALKNKIIIDITKGDVSICK